jgi:hypothetical protein
MIADLTPPHGVIRGRATMASGLAAGPECVFGGAHGGQKGARAPESPLHTRGCWHGDGLTVLWAHSG